MRDKRKMEEIAINRLKLITPLLDESLDFGKLQSLKREIHKNAGISERTIRRYLLAYKKEGFEGLLPKTSGRKIETIIPQILIMEAIKLRREVPSRSVSSIIRIMEWEGLESGCFMRNHTLRSLPEKIERFNRTMDAFLAEISIVKPKSLEELNKLYHIWLEECYQNAPHSALKEQTSPCAA